MFIAAVVILVGLLLLVDSVLSIVSHSRMVNWILPLAIGSLLFVAGFVLLITELMETWLSRGQRALVDGLQAG